MRATGRWTGFVSNCQAQQRRNRVQDDRAGVRRVNELAASHPVAVELAKQNGGKIVIAHVVERIAARGGSDLYADEDERQASIRNQAKELSDQGIETSVEMTAISLGGPAHSIAEIANEAGADVIVVGTRGHSTVSGLLLGSVTQRLLHIAHRPVLAVPPAS